MTHITVILSIPPIAAHLYAQVGQPLKDRMEGLVMIQADQIEHIGQFVRLRLVEHTTLEGTLVSVPVSFVALIVSGDSPRSLGFSNG